MKNIIHLFLGVVDCRICRKWHGLTRIFSTSGLAMLHSAVLETPVVSAASVQCTHCCLNLTTSKPKAARPHALVPAAVKPVGAKHHAAQPAVVKP